MASAASVASASPSPTPTHEPFFLPRRHVTAPHHSHPSTTTHTSSPSSSSSSSRVSLPSEPAPHLPSDELSRWKADSDTTGDDPDSALPQPPPPPPPATVVLPSAKARASAFVRPAQTSRMVEVWRDDIFACIFAFFDGHSVALLSCVSSQWNDLLQDPMIWQHAAFHYWGDLRHSTSLLPRYGGSWKRMICERPHPRFDGVYVLETKYWKPGAERFGQKLQRIIECCYYRYLHFLPNGVVYYALLNQPPSLTSPIPLHHRQLSAGQYLLSERGHHLLLKVDVAHETQFLKVQMRGTRGEVRSWNEERANGGAWNRLKVVEFRGKGPNDRAAFMYPLPATEFIFYTTSGIEQFGEEEMKERMRTLLESNDDQMPPDNL